MTLLDRFRTQPRHKHPDPSVRLAYVEEIPLDDRETIVTMAREDESARVRLAAVAKLLDPAALGAVVREDQDEAVRQRAAVMLRDIALDAFEGTAEADGVAAVDSLVDVKALVEIARAATRETVALRALSRLADPHTLGSVARHAASEAARMGALAWLRERGERAELLAVALNGDYKDSAAAAVDLVVDRADQEQIAARAKNKSAVKRARTLLREADEQQAAAEKLEAEALAAAAAVAAEAAERAARAAAEESARRAAIAVAEEAAARAPVDVEAPPAPVDVEAAQAAADAADVRRAAADIAEQREAERRRQAELERQAAREAAALKQAEAARARQEALGRLQQVLSRVEPLLARTDLTLKAGERAVREVRAALGAIPPVLLQAGQDAAGEVLRRLKAAQAVLAPRVLELREADEWRRWANLGLQEQLAARMEALKSLADPEAVAREVRQLQEQWREVADAPRAQAEVLWQRFKTAHDEVWAKCEAHFAADAEVRNANLARKLALCEQAEALSDSTSWIQTAEALKGLQAEWKTIGPVARGREKATWDRFRTACDRFFSRRQADLASLKASWAENLARKDALCAQAEALADSSDWDHAAAEIKRLQAEWKTIGPVKKSRSEAIWQRFRGACDRFFSRYASRHDTARAERIAAREAICAEVEGLAAPVEATAPAEGDASATLAAGAPDGVALLAKVREIGNRWQQELTARGVDPDTARALDARFRAGMAAVISKWPAAFAGTDLDPDANRKRMEALVVRVEALATSLEGKGGAAADQELSPTNRLAAMLKEALAANTIGGKVEEDSRLRAAVEDVRQAQSAWSRIGQVPDELRRPLAARFDRACARVLARASAATGPGGSAATGRPSGSGGGPKFRT
jgi:hypothetical protein